MGRTLAHLLCRGFEIVVTCAAIFIAVHVGDSFSRS